MTTKYNLTFSYLITVLTICSCESTDNGKNKTLDTTTSKTTIEQATELKPALNIGGTYSFGDNVEKEAVGSVIESNVIAKYRANPIGIPDLNEYENNFRETISPLT